MKCETDGNPQPEFDFTKDVSVRPTCRRSSAVLCFLPLSVLNAPLLFNFKGKPFNGQGGVLTFKSVKRTDNGMYTCTATDFENMEANLTGSIRLNVNCEFVLCTYTRLQNTDVWGNNFCS